MDIKDFFTDEEKEEQGVWVDCGDGLEIKVRRMFNSHFNRVLAAKRKPMGRRYDRSTELQEQVLVEVIAETVLIDWKGLENAGKPLKYDAKTALDLLKRSRDFRNIVSLAADDVGNFQSEEAEEDAKN